MPGRDLVQLAADGPMATVALIATLAPIAYYGRLLVIGFRRPDRVLEPADAWRPVVSRSTSPLSARG